MTGPTVPPSPMLGSWAWWRRASLEDVVYATGSRVGPRLLFAASFWVFIIAFSFWPTPASGASVGVAVCMVLAVAAWMVVVRRVGWPSLVAPFIRPDPFLGYWLWVFFAPPRRKSGAAEWVAWVAVFSPFLYTLLPD